MIKGRAWEKIKCDPQKHGEDKQREEMIKRSRTIDISENAVEVSLDEICPTIVLTEAESIKIDEILYETLYDYGKISTNTPPKGKANSRPSTSVEVSETAYLQQGNKTYYVL